jgi:hypothetical protein
VEHFHAIRLQNTFQEKATEVLNRSPSIREAPDSQVGHRLSKPFRDSGYKALLERVVLVRVEAFDWDCPQHITPPISTGGTTDAGI